MNDVKDQAEQTCAAVEALQPTVVVANELLGPTRSVVIVHKGECYQLRLTRNDKLILTK